MNVVVLDLETTGLSPERDSIVEIGAMRIIDGVIQEADIFHSLVNPERPIPYYVSKVHGIYDHHVASAPKLAEVLPQFLNYTEGALWVAHNASFDIGFLKAATQKLGLPWVEPSKYCTLQLSRKAFPHHKNHKLDQLAERFGLQFESRHRSMGDVKVTARAFVELSQMLNLKV